MKRNSYNLDSIKKRGSNKGYTNAIVLPNHLAPNAIENFQSNKTKLKMERLNQLSEARKQMNENRDA